jgi:hypothetical protein
MARRIALLLGLAAAAALAAPRTASTCSQCLCGSPTPPGYLLADPGPGVALGFEDRYLSKSNALGDAPGEERQNEHRLAALVRYRPGARVSLQARLPYLVKTNTAAPADLPRAIERSHGFGDVELVARVDVARFGNPIYRRFTLGPVAVASLPTGANDVRDAAGERLDAHLQPGTGAWSGQLGLAADAAFQSSAVTASVLGRVNGTNARGYRYGGALLVNAGYARVLGSSWQVTAELNGRAAARDRTESGARDPNSGGTVLYLAPGLRWAGPRGLAAEAAVQVPVAQALYGVQSEHLTARVGLVLAVH